MSDGETIIQERRRPSLADLVDQRKREARRHRSLAPTRLNWLDEGRFSRWHVPESAEQEADNWLLTYLDMLTLLLAMLVVMLGISRLPPVHKPGDPPMTLVGSVARGGLPAYAGPIAFDNTPLVPASWADIPLPGELPPANPADVGPLPRVAQAPAPLVPPSIKDLGLSDLGKGVEVVINSQSISFRISNELLFPSGQATLNPDGLAVLKKLAVVVNRSKYPLSVEGHSDNIPIQTPQFPSNWELSASRATSVLRELVRDGVANDRLRAVGYADTRPLKPNDTLQGRAANRRVELILQITPRRPDAPDAEPSVPMPASRVLPTGAKPAVSKP
ncbi:MAG TPA: OmpA family protein [Bordetella sp.]